MKILFFLLIILTACSSTESVKKTVETPPPQEAPKQDAPKEIENIDLELQAKLQEVWKQYFVEEFNDSRAVNVLVVTNRNMKGKTFGCTDNHLGVNTDAALKVGL